MTSDAETIADLRKALRDRELEIVWLKDELRHADNLLLERARIASGEWQRCPAGGGLVRKPTKATG